MKRQPGFTLVELMIVCAVLGIIAMVAIPAYTDQIARGRRGEAKTALLRGAQQMERFYTTHNCYPSNTTACSETGLACSGGANVTTSALALCAASINAWSGDNASHSKYTVTVTTNAQDFTLTATPATSTTDPKCGTLTIANTGGKTSSAGTSAECWAR
jgi:type IV pilus assembly protein PilE